jgi:8-oxo-dGTP pyrophosphatase MutT (NUDIX family)
MNNYTILERFALNLRKVIVSDANAAVAILLRSNNKDIEVLLVKRAIKLTDPWSGQVALPGGKKNSNNEHLKNTAIRETLEETGIDLRKFCKFLGIMESFRSVQKSEMKIVPFVFFQEKKQKIKLNDELVEYFWVSLKDIHKNKRVIKYQSKEYTAYIIDQYKIWGLTFRIIEKLLMMFQY